MSVSDDQIRRQSETAYKQWCEQWREHAKIHSRFKQKSLDDFSNIGIGRAVLAIANGYSFEENIDTIKKYQDQVDIICVDKCLKSLLDNGIKPTYVILCDANVSYETYLKPVENELEDIILFSNVCANPKWTKNGNWKDIYFFVNMDVLKSEREFCQLSGCKNVIAAGTNVSNAQMIFLTQCDNRGFNNFFGYDKILLIGYDYCWDDDGYYAFDHTGDGKTNYMKNIHLIDNRGEPVFTSNNLLFSAKWLDKYVRTFKIQAIQCSKRSIYSGIKIADLEDQMQYKYKPEDSDKVRNLLQYKRDLAAKLKEADSQIFKIGRDHFKSVIRTT